MSITMQMRHRVELNAPLFTRHMPGVLQEGDSEANAFVLEVYQDEQPFDLTGYTPSGYLLRADGNSVLLDGTVDGNTATVPLSPACYKVPGFFAAFVRLTNADGQSRTLIKVAGTLEAENLDGIVDDENILPSIDELLAQLDAMETAREEAIAAANTATEAAQQVEGRVQEAIDAAEDAATAANNAITAANNATTAANNAKTAADNAVIAAGNAEQDAAETRETANELSRDVENINAELGTKVDGAYVENGYLYLTSDGEVVAGPLGPFSGTGGGSGGSTNAAVLTVTNTTGFLTKTIASGASLPLTFSWSSIEDELPTGDGQLIVKVGGVSKLTKTVQQGNVDVDVGPYLAAGSNAVKVTIADQYGNSRTINFTINAVAISLTSTFDNSGTFGSAIPFTYVPVGAVTKTVHFEVDGTEIGTASVATTGRQMTYNIPQQTHGAHYLRVWFEAEIDGQTVTSNELYYDLICTVEGDTTPIIASAFRQTSAQQFETLVIPYRVYDPAGLTAAVSLMVDGEEVSAITVDRTEQTWTYIPLNTGDMNLTIKCGDVQITFTLPVSESSIDVEAEQNDLSLYLTSYGRSNGEADPGTWKYGEVAATFTGFNFKSDGWQKDAGGNTVLRVTGDARVEVPFQIFQTDFRSTGKTIEVEFATRDVLDYDAMILSSMSDGRGISITAQRADMASEQSAIGTQYKEEEHVRLTFVTEKRSGNRLILIYLNGIISGIKQYPDTDDFSQGSPVGISIGSNDSTIDLYNIRVYDNDLTRYQVLDNWIADTASGTEKLARFERNQIYDDYGQVVPENLPKNLPYMMIVGAALPTDKGDKKTISGYYVDPMNADRSFTFADAEIDVQGTSSKDYYVKNFKIKFKGGFEVNGEQVENYALRGNDIPVNVFTMKADVASSEGANNVELVRLYNDISPHRTPPQATDSRVRQGIDGLPCVIFWDNGSTVAFQGKYNFNHDKASAVFGFASGDQSWEIRNNVSNRVLFKSADFSDTSSETGWPNDFEARYPEDSTDITDLAAFVAWVVSTDREAATGEAITPVSYNGVIYETDTADYRLAKFRNELSAHADVTSAQFYWLFTEFFLMVDSRAKNAFPTKFAADGKWCWLPYDMDTAIGINNEGALVFDYALEDTDLTEAGELVFNGQNSVFWQNVRDCFADEIAAMYVDLRTSGKLSYDVVMERFDSHQDVWPEAIFNEDAFRKYIEPYEKENATIYFPMAQGKKELQRTWWLYNRFRYMDARYDTGTIASDRILIRIYADADIAITPYADTYLRSKYGSYSYTVRAKRDQEYLLHCYVDAANDLETTLYPASLIAEIADLAPLHIGLADFSKATKLQVLKIGDAAEDYSNGNLTELTLGNNTLLHQLDVRNCPNLTTSVDLSGCTNIEHVWFDGTGITGLSLPNGGILKTLHLPGTVTNLTVLNQKAITDFVLPSYAQITTLRIENSADVIDTATILAAIPAASRVRLIGIDWTLENADAVFSLYDRLDTMRGLDENGSNVDKAQVQGVLHIDSLTGAELAEMQSRYPYITIDYAHITSYLYFYDETGANLLGMAEVQDGGDGAWDGTNPTKASTAQYTYAFAGWSLTPGGSANADALKGVTADRNVYAAFTATVRTYTVKWYNGSTLLETDTNQPYGTVPTYDGDEPVDETNGYPFDGWTPSVAAITGDTTYTAKFASPKAVAEITDDWATIFSNIDNGTYSSVYKVGNYKPLDLGSEGVINMQIAGIDKDQKADGTGTAPISWIGIELLRTLHRINPSRVTNDDGTYQEGTGPIGGWEKCEMRTYLNDTILPLIPEEVRSRIVPVTKIQTSYTTTGTSETQKTTETVWIPDYGEVVGSSSLYYGLFENKDDNRIKYHISSSSGKYWWLRSAYGAVTFRIVYGNGYPYNSNDVNSNNGVALGFCT